MFFFGGGVGCGLACLRKFMFKKYVIHNLYVC